MLHAVLQRQGFRQFVKFCIVGASSTLIDFGIYLFLMEIVHLREHVGSLFGARVLAQSISFVFAVTNGFIWNSRWTFRHTNRDGLRARYTKFVLTNAVGLLLNLSILNLVAFLVPYVLPPVITAFLSGHLKDPTGFIGKLTATGVVVFWNFCASKYWTFKK